MTSDSPSTLTSPSSSARHVRGIIEIAVSGLCFGFLGVFGKIAYAKGLSVGELLSYRFVVATALLGFLLLVFSRGKLRIDKKQIPICAGLGIFGYAVFSTLYFTAIQGVSVALASLLLYTYPAWVAGGARIFFGERLTKTQAAALPLAAVGLIALLWNDLNTTSVQGAVQNSETARSIAILAGLGSAVCYSAYILASSRLQKSVEPLSSGLYVMLFASIGLLAFHRPDVSTFVALVRADREVIWIVLGIAFFCTVLPLVLFLSGLQKLGNTEASLLSTVEPVTAAFVGTFILGEVMRANEVLGGAIVLTALVMTVLGSRRQSLAREKT